MRKIISIFAMLLLFATTGWAQLTSQNDVNPNKCYTVTTNGRGSWTMATDGSALRSTSNISQTVDATNTDQQWAFVEYGGNTYLYNVGKQKFILKNGTEASASAERGTPIELYQYTSTEMAGWGENYDAFQSGGYYLCAKMGTDGTYPTYINFNTEGDGYQTRVTAWGPGNTGYDAKCGADAGNALKIVEVGEFDPTAALESLKWSINFDKSTVSTHASRYTDMVGLDDSRITWSSHAGDVIYRDLTNQTLTVYAGETVTPYIGFRGWSMYGYLYIDYNNDGDFTDDGELVSQLAGNTWASESTADKTIPDFTVTSTPGTYRARFKVAWNNTDPGGVESDMVSNGGSITDVMVQVVKNVNVTYNLEINSSTVKSVNVEQHPYTAVSIPSSLTSGYSNLAWTFTPSGSIGTEDCTITVTGTLAEGVITSLSQLSNNKAYTITCERGSLGTNGTQMVSTFSTQHSYTASNFAIIKYNENYYLYSVADSKWVSFNAQPTLTSNVSEVKALNLFAMNTNPLFFMGMGVNNAVNVANYEHGLVIDNQMVPDAGNQYVIKAVADFDPTTALANLDEDLVYPINCSASAVSTHASRYTTGVGLDDSRIEWTSQARDVIYRDSTAHTFTVTAGATVTPYIGYHGAWMNGFFYVDLNNDGIFTVSNPGDRTTANTEPNGELLSYKNQGDVLKDGNRTLPAFTVPATPGTYRARFKADWASTDPGGSATYNSDENTFSSIITNGGVIVDVTLQVVEQEVKIVDGTSDPIGTLNSKSVYSSSANSNINILTSLAASGKAGVTVSNIAVSDQGNYFTPTKRCMTIQPSAVKTAEKITITAPTGYVITGYSIDCRNNRGKNPYLVDTSDEYGTSPTSISTSSTMIEKSNINEAQTSFWIYCNSNTMDWLMIPSFVVRLLPAATTHNVTYNVKDGSNNDLYTSEAVAVAEGMVVTMLPEDCQLPEFYYYNTVNETVDGDKTVTFTATPKENPLVRYTADATSPTYYYLNISSTSSNAGIAYPTYVADPGEGGVNVQLPATDEHTDNTMWAFVGEPYAGFKIINKAAGTGRVLGSTTAAGDGANGGNTHATLNAPGTKTYETWFVTPSSYATGGFFLNNEAGQYLNRRSNDNLAYWTDGHDAGSTFVAALTPNYDNFYSMVEPYNAAHDDHSGEYFQLVGNEDQAYIDYKGKLDEATSKYNQGNDMSNQEYTEAVAAFKAAIVMPPTGYYRIKSNMMGTDNYGYIGLNASKVFMGNISSEAKLTDASTVFYVQKNSNLYSFSSESGYANAAGKSANVGFDESNAHDFTVGTNVPGAGYIQTNGSNAYSCFHIGKNQDYRVVGWTATSDASQLVFEPATTITLNLHNGGDGYYYATTYLPFGITLPESVKAYAMTVYESESFARITELAQAIPAGTAVLLKSQTVSSVDAAITPDLSPINITNSLSGTYFSKTLDNGQYSLGIANNKVGFYHLTDALSANRAYLTMSSGIRAIYFEEDEVTGIGNAGAGGAVVGEAYDLQGRRVTTMQRGGVYIINGKKVIK